MTASLAVTGSIASTTRKFIDMLERKHKGILSLNLKKSANYVDDFKTILILKNDMLLLILFSKYALKQREHISRYAKTKNNYFLGKVVSTYFCANCLFKNTVNALIN